MSCWSRNVCAFSPAVICTDVLGLRGKGHAGNLVVRFVKGPLELLVPEGHSPLPLDRASLIPFGDASFTRKRNVLIYFQVV